MISYFKNVEINGIRLLTYILQTITQNFDLHGNEQKLRLLD